MTPDKAIKILTDNKEHWQRLLREQICDKTEGEEFIEAMDMAISAIYNQKIRNEKIRQRDKAWEEEWGNRK